MIDIEIQTYWNVETLYTVLNAVAATMSSAGFSGLMKLVFLFALIVSIFAYAGNKQIEIAKWFIQGLIFVTILNLPIARVGITDKTGLEPPKVVDNVPVALAVMAQTTNLVFGYFTKTYETTMGVPDELGLQRGDLGFGHRILRSVNSAVVSDPGLRADLMQFIKECTIYDIKDGEIEARDVVQGTDTWNLIFEKTSPARFVTYKTLSSEPETSTCKDVAAKLKVDVDAATAAAQTYYGKQAFSRASSDSIAQTMYVSAIGTSYDWILNTSASASNAMRQSMFNNLWKDAGSELPALLNDPARVSEVNAAMASAQAARSAAGANSSISVLAQETLPHMRNWLEAILFALFPIVVVMTVVVSVQGAKQILGGYLMALAWIGLWPVLFAIINHLSLMHLRHKAKALSLATSGGVPFQMSDVFEATLSDEQSMIGYMVILVPFIAGAIIKMGQGGFMSVADRMTTGFSGAATQAAGQGAMGNFSSGQTAIDTASVNTTSMHRYDSNIGLSGGGAAVSNAFGNTISSTASGRSSFSQAQNRLLTQMEQNHRRDSTQQQEALVGSTASAGVAVSKRDAEAAARTDVVGRDATRANSQALSVMAGNTSSGSTGGSASNGLSLMGAHAANTSLQTGAGAVLTGGANLGLSTPGGGSAPAASGAAPISAADEKRISDGIIKGGGTPAQAAQAVANAKAAGNAPSPKSGFKLPISGSLRLDASKNYRTEHQNSKNVETALRENEDANRNANFQDQGFRTGQQSRNETSNQGSREAADASKSKVSEFNQVQDAALRNDRGFNNRGSRSAADSFNRRYEMTSDPAFLEAVAMRNGMSSVRFFAQEIPSQIQMIDGYLAEKDMLQAASTLPSRGMDNQPLPSNEADVKTAHTGNTKRIVNDISTKHAKNVRAVGAGSTAPLNVDTSAPSSVANARGQVLGALDPKNKDSIPARSAEFVANVNANASPDKPIGAGRVNPAGNNEDIAIRDGKDALLKGLDKLKGGDGSADGEKFTPNMKESRTVPIPKKGENK